MKKEYFSPELNVMLLSAVDVLTGSPDEKQPVENDPFVFSVDRYWQYK